MYVCVSNILPLNILSYVCSAGNWELNKDSGVIRHHTDLD